MKILKLSFIYLITILYSYSLILKITDINNFKIKLVQSELIDNNFVDFIGYLIPLIEFTLIILIFFNIKRKETLISSLFYLVILTGYLLALNEFSLFNGCSCGGVFDKLTYSQHISVNLIFIAINLIVITINKRDQVTISNFKK
jgi:hypothetical protein